MTEQLLHALDDWQEQVEREYATRATSSRSMHERARRSMPGGDTRYSLTLSPFSVYFTRGEGSFLWDVDGNRYIDLVNQATAMIHGHAHPTIAEAVGRRIADGTGWSGPNVEQVELAELLCERVPSVERLRYTNSGTEAVAMMVKVARAYTGRDLVMKMGATYHGSADLLEFGPDSDDSSRAVPYTGGVPRNLGDNLVIGRFNDTEGVLELIEHHGDRLAAVLLTPVLTVGFVEPAPDFLEAVRRATSERGILLLYDEVISFRLARGGAQERYGVVPDMTAFGKIIGGGFPVGAFGGRVEIMRLTNPEGELRVAHAGTYNGNPVTSTAGRVAMELLTPAAYDRLETLGARIRSGLESAVRETGAPFRVTGVGSLVGLDLEPPEGEPAWAEVGPRLTRVLRIAWLTHGVHALGIAGTTVMSDDEADIALAAMRATLAQLMEHIPVPTRVSGV